MLASISRLDRTILYSNLGIMVNLKLTLTFLFTVAVLLPLSNQKDVKAQEDVKALKAEISTLKQRVKQLELQLETAEHNGFHWPGVKPIGSPMAMTKDLPKELKLQRQKYWNKLELKKANVEFKQFNGKPFAAKVKIEKLNVQETETEGVFKASFVVQ